MSPEKWVEGEPDLGPCLGLLICKLRSLVRKSTFLSTIAVPLIHSCDFFFLAYSISGPGQIQRDFCVSV